jgi:hypothetical protein
MFIDPFKDLPWEADIELGCFHKHQNATKP